MSRLRKYVERELAREKRRAGLEDPRGLKYRELMGRVFAYADVLRAMGPAEAKSGEPDLSDEETDRLLGRRS